MSPAGSPPWLVTDSAGSPGEGTADSGGPSDYRSKRRRGVQYILDAGSAIKATLFSSYANLLLILVPLGIVAGALEWNPAAVFVLNFLAIFPLAALLSYSTEELSANVGQTFGGLINATFGNAVEMIVGITALSRGEIRIVQSSMVGSILSSNLLILGSCFFFAGYGKDTLTFNTEATGIMSSLMIVSSASLIVPSALSSTSTPSKSLDPIDNVLVLSHITSLILLAFYLIYLYFQLKSHSHLFDDGDATETDERHELGPWAASVVLIIATIGVAECSDYLVDSIDGVVEASGVSRAFIGLIIVPIIGNAGEYFTSINAAMKDKLDLAIGLVVGSTLQIALFVIPFMVILGWIIGQPMALRFDTFETTVFFLAVIVVNCLIQSGRINYFEGAMLLGTYTLIGIAFFIHPDVVDTI